MKERFFLFGTVPVFSVQVWSLPFTATVLKGLDEGASMTLISSFCGSVPVRGHGSKLRVRGIQARSR